ncbi:MAG: malto-oligosyltrehalose trehalohydrolase [Candidatus Sulfobium sp.]|jgi:maltooligosyltrehalose trehalohydrolase
MQVGAHYLGDERCRFAVWAPFLRDVSVHIVAPADRTIPMEKDDRGYWEVTASEVPPGTEYYYRLDAETERSDPASHFQPRGVHGPSEVVDHASFSWQHDARADIPVGQMILYELHVGTFTPEGTFDAVIPRLDELHSLGINAIELMPVSQFPGDRNWGYDGVCPFAVQKSYGGPEGLKRLVDACHSRGVAVVLDVVYNHLGPEGNYLRDFGPYFTEKYNTPWGAAINFDDAYSDEVRNFFIENALYWFSYFHVDGLRLDAIHAIYDMSAVPFLKELAESVAGYSAEEGRPCHLIAESDRNDSTVIHPREQGGYGMDAQWNDDFHHALHALLTGEKTGYYIDFGMTDHLVKAYREGFVYSGQYSIYRKRRQGNSSADRPADQFVIFAQNHDQIGNRMLGERLSALVSFDALKLAAAAVLLSPCVPLLFMGEEYGENAPFIYFVSHSDPDLIRAVREGRKREFSSFEWQGEPPDPQDEATFQRSKIDWEKREQGHHGALREFYRTLIRLRREWPALSSPDKTGLDVGGGEEDRIVMMKGSREGQQVVVMFNFNIRPVDCTAPEVSGVWKKLLDSSAPEWKGPGSSLPEEGSPGQKLTLPELSVAAYRGT